MTTVKTDALGALTHDLTQITTFVVALSILVHGTSVKPLMGRYWGRKKK